MVREYSLCRDGEIYLSPHFQVQDFACNDGSDQILIDGDLVDLLEKIRAAVGGKPVLINSAYRTPEYNASPNVGGAKTSQHLYGRAADVVVSGASPLLVGQIAEYYLGWQGGIGVYNGFTHVDTRAIRSRWDQRSGKQIVVGGWPGWEETMSEDQFYQMFLQAMATYNKKLSEKTVSEWAEEAWDKATKTGLFDGTMPRAPLTREQVAVILDRLEV